MDNDLNKNPNGTKRSSSSPTSSTRPRQSTTPMSAEEKLRKSMKGLSHMGGVGNLNLNSSNASKTSDSASRKKVGGVVLDLETIQDAHKQKFETKGRRNNVVILILSLLLVVSLVYLVIAIMGYNNSKRPPNCKYFVQGNASAEWIIEGGKKTKFLVRQGLGPDTIYLVDSSIKINSTESVSLSIEVKASIDGKEFLIAGLQDKHVSLVRVENTNRYVYQSSITGGGTINLFKGIDFSEAPMKLNSNNILIEITAYVQKL